MSSRIWNPASYANALKLAGLIAGITAASATHAAVFRFADNGFPLRWNINQYDSDLLPDQNPVTLAIRFHLMAEGWSSTNRTRELDAIRSAFAQWQAIPGLRLRFEEAATVSNVTDVDASDFKNTVVWLHGNRFINQNHSFFSAFATGITVLTGSITDEIIAEADIALNSDLSWVTDYGYASFEAQFVEAVALHEIGHFIGLNHSPAGGATLFSSTVGGINSTAGLSADDITAALALYGDTATLKSRSTLKGTVTAGSTPVLGAVVSVEGASGTLLASTVTRSDGSYQLPALPAGAAQVRVTPLDGASSNGLVSGPEIDTSDRNEYTAAATGFLPVPAQPVTLPAGATLSRNLTVTNGTAPFRIARTRRFLTPDDRTAGAVCIQLTAGLTNAWVGVYVPSLPATNADLRLTGDGLTIGPTVVVPKALAGMTLIQAPVSVSPTASPGLRSLSVTSGGYTAWAIGFAEVQPSAPDFNFDGLDDRFQRRYWSPFTRAEAAPNADPDGDGFVNRREYVMGSDPTNAASVNYRITQVKLDASGTTVTWESAPGRRYQVYRRSALGGAITWISVGSPVVASGEAAQILDPQPTQTIQFYQVRDAQ